MKKIDIIGLTEAQYNNLIIFFNRVNVTGKNEAIAYLELEQLFRTGAVMREENTTG